MNTGIFLADGSFQPFASESLSTELSPPCLTRDTILWALPDPDPLLRERGDTATVLMELLADDQVCTTMLARKNRVLNCDHYAFRPGSPENRAPDVLETRVHQEFTRDLERINVRSLMSGMLDAPFFGMSPLEIIWHCEKNWWHILDIVPRPFHWFAFNARNELLIRGPHGELEPVPAGKCVLVSHHASYDNPYGIRLLSRCLWPVTFKRAGIQFYSRFVERHGMPWVVGKAPARATREEKKLMAADLARMVQDCVAAIPAGAEVQFLTAGGTQKDLHEQFLARQDKAIAKVLMGQTLTIEMEGANSLAAAQTHADVAADIANTDKAMLADAFNEICWLYTRVNTPSETSAPIFIWKEPANLHIHAELDCKLYQAGVRFNKEYFQEHYGIKEQHFEVKGEE